MAGLGWWDPPGDACIRCICVDFGTCERHGASDAACLGGHSVCVWLYVEARGEGSLPKLA